MLIVHHLENSRSQRVLWLLEELGVEYEIKRYERDKKTMLAPRELRAVHPLGKSPVVTDDGQTIAESGAIVEYLVERHGKGRLVPDGGNTRELRYTYWLHYAEGSAMPPLLLKLVFERDEDGTGSVLRAPDRARHRRQGPRDVRRSAAEAPSRLHGSAARRISPGSREDEFSAADIQMSFPLEAAQARASLETKTPNVTAFLEKIHARPAYQRALERGGPYELMS